MNNQTLFDKYLQGKHWAEHPTMYAERFAEFLKQKQFTGKLVDIGCGSGRDVEVFRAQSFNVLGFDYDEKEVANARKYFPESRFEVANVENLPFEEDSIGAYFMINVMHYVDAPKAMGEILRTLVPGGYACIHFNLSITDANSVIDYAQSKESVMELTHDFSIISESTFSRTDYEPVEHTHEILELILQKN